MRCRRLLLVLVATAVWSAGVAAVPATGAPTYSVALSATPTTLETGESTTLTTTANTTLVGTRYTTYVYDQGDPTWYRTCKVQSCSFAVAQDAPGTHSYIAYIARDRAEPRYPPMQVQATSDVVSVTWTAAAVTLHADRTWLPPGSAAELTAQSTTDVTGRTVALQIYDLASGSRIGLCTTGTTCSALVSEVSPTTRSYQAYVATPSATFPPPGVRARSEIVSITWSPLPDPSRPPNVGGGPVTGTVTFADGEGVPPAGAPCAATSFDFAGTSEAAWVNGTGTAYVGPLVITGGGGSDCETASNGNGTVALSASGTSDTGTLDCGPLVGTFTRVLTDVTVVLSGDCSVNGFSAFSVSFLAKGEFVPVNDGGGATSPVTDATFAGAFTVVPN